MVAVAVVVGWMSKFGGIYAVALTMPWSGLGVLISDAVDPKLLDTGYIGMGILAVGAAMNSIILFRLVRGRRAKGVGVSDTTDQTRAAGAVVTPNPRVDSDAIRSARAHHPER